MSRSKIRSVLDKLYSKHLLTTNTFTCGALLTIGDCIVQFIDRKRTTNFSDAEQNVKNSYPKQNLNGELEVNTGQCAEDQNFHSQRHGPKGHDWERSGRMCFLGLLMGPLNHYFYLLLDRHLVGRGLKIIGKKIAADQFIAAPLFNTVFLFGSCYLERKTTTMAAQEWKDKFPVIYMGDWVFWPPIQFVNFYFFPPKFRVLYVAVATLMWNTYLSYVKHTNISLKQFNSENSVNDLSKSSNNIKETSNSTSDDITTSTSEQTSFPAPNLNIT